MVIPDGDHPLAQASEGRLLASLFSPDDLGIDAPDETLLAMVGTGASDAEIEAAMREAWGLPQINLAEELKQPAKPLAEKHVEDDYTDDEWLIVRRMRELCAETINRGTSLKRRKAAIEWLFVRGTAEQRLGIEFHLACQMFEARPWVVHALIHHIWWTKGIQPGPLPFLADPLPEALSSEAILSAWDSGPPILEALWRWPGAPLHAVRELVPEITDEEYDRSLARLLDVGLIAEKDGFGYVSARSAKVRRRMSWSRTFVGD